MTTDTASYTPQNPDQYTIAIICALVKEFDAVQALFDEGLSGTYDGSGRLDNDKNVYVVGRFADHHAVLMMPGSPGELDAGLCTQRLRDHFPNIKLTLLVGICGAMSQNDETGEPIYLGDVIVGTKVWRYLHNARGNQLQNGGIDLQLRNLMSESPSQRVKQLGNLIRTEHFRKEITNASSDILKFLQKRSKDNKYGYPSDKSGKATPDILFQPDYVHRHRAANGSCDCANPSGNNCEEVKQIACKDLGCKESGRARTRSQTEVSPMLNIHVGTIASSDVVLRAKSELDTSFRSHNVLGIDMEGGGVSEATDCIIIKGAVDYADTHKSKDFALYAAAAAASVAKAFLMKLFIGKPTQPSSKEPSEAPWFVPFTRTQYFAGREAQFVQLSAHVSSEGGQRLAIYGLGGCGKTALALELAYRTREWEPTRAIFWVPALSQESFEQAYREIGLRLRIPEMADAKADVKQLVKARLSNESFGSWLMIIDNADDTSVLLDPLREGDGRNRLIDYLPNSCRGSFIFTTRTRKAAVNTAGHNNMALGKLTKLEATEVLRTRLLQEHQYELMVQEKVDEFLDTLTCLALAIVQAVAFINTNDISLSKYISHYRYSEENASELLREDFEDYGRYRDTKNPVATTWYISFEHIRKYDKLAAEYLSFMACTSNSDIPESMLPANKSTIAQTKAIGTLKAYAFIAERQPQTDTQQGQRQRLAKAFDVHPLVHRAMQSWLKEHGQWNVWLERSLTRLIEIIPFGDYKTRTVWTGYIPHATHIVYLEQAYMLEGRLLLLERIGRCEQTLGRYQNAEQTHRQVLEKRKKNLGEEHPDTLTSMSHVARALNRQGKYAEAEKMHRETLALRKKVLGEEHPDTLTSMNNVARALNRQGKYAEAEKIDRETLALRKKVSGEEHPDTLTSMSHVADALSRQGKYAEAEKMDRETLALRKKVLGEEHPDTLTSMNNVARALNRQGKYAEAEKIDRETLALRKKVSGEEHPHTLTSMSHVARALNRQGKYAEAEKMHRETLALRKKVLGEEHPDTLTSMSNLAITLSNQCCIDEAITLLDNCFVIGKQTFSILPLHIQHIPEIIQAWQYKRNRQKETKESNSSKGGKSEDETKEENEEHEEESDESEAGGIIL